jgi:hypothetical protein
MFGLPSDKDTSWSAVTKDLSFDLKITAGLHIVAGGLLDKTDSTSVSAFW